MERMMTGLLISVYARYGGTSLSRLSLVIQILGLLFFAYIVCRRLVPLAQGECDVRFDRPWLRLQNVLKFWCGQWKHPRYRIAGTLHLLIFAGFLILATRAFYLLLFGLSDDFVAPGVVGRTYDVIADYAATIVFLAVARLRFAGWCLSPRAMKCRRDPAKGIRSMPSSY